MLLTMEIKANKKSIVNKLGRTSKTFQQFKNLIYLCALEYYQNTKDIKPFLKKAFLEKFVKGKVDLPYLNKVFNADLNGALNIAIKKLGKEAREKFLSLANWLDKLSRAVKLTLFPYSKYSVSPLFQRITDSSSYLFRGSEGHLKTNEC
jgi:hypothetical protein